VYTGNNGSTDAEQGVRFLRANSTAPWVKASASDNTSHEKDLEKDWDVKASRSSSGVVATTDTAVGEVGVELKSRADFNGNKEGKLYMKTAWGYWAMTPELTLGGGLTTGFARQHRLRL